MFPYPSGEGLHIGHWYNYAIVDSYCKLQRYLGYEVFQPFGYDAFGLPAENYAKKIGGHVKEITYKNIENFRQEMSRMNTSFKEILITSNENYIKQTQWLFTELYKKDMAYKAIRSQEYCSSCQTVLAKEQVKNNKCERCGTEIEFKELEQWFFRITKYRDRLIQDLDKIDYPEKTKKQQLHWLENLHDWCVSRQRKWGCPIPVEGETDTLDTFVDSSFYTIMYCIIKEIKPIPVDIYVGGNEHACMHLIYARFITKFLYDIGYIDFDEPFLTVVHQGMILKDGEKMSKSKGNVVDPRQYNPKELRMYLMFINHYFDGGSWSDAHFSGVQKFNKRMNVWFSNSSDTDVDINLLEFKNKIISLFESWKTNKIVSEFMIFYNKNKNTILSTKTKNELEEFYNVIF